MAARVQRPGSPTMDLLLDATFMAERSHFWFRGLRRFVRPLLAETTAGLERPLLLDCGCGTGANLELLAEFGRAIGIDAARAGLGRARARGQARLAQASVARLPFPSDSFDVVMSLDVLYCLEGPIETAAIAEMARVLRPGGALIVNVAALRSLRGNHSILSQELRRYTRRELREKLERAGFRISRSTYTNATLFPALFVLRLLQRAVGLVTPERAGREIALPPRPINAALSAALAVEAQALRLANMPFGSSVLCLARKPA